MSRTECIEKDGQLAIQLDLFMKARGWSRRRLATEAGVSYHTVFSMFNPGSRYACGVREEKAVRIIETLIPDQAERMPVLEGIGVRFFSVHGLPGIPNRINQVL